MPPLGTGLYAAPDAILAGSPASPASLSASMASSLSPASSAWPAPLASPAWLTTATPAAAATGEPPYRALLFVATALAVAGVFLSLHGAPAYALLIWEGGAGVAAWVYLHPAVGGFLFAAAAFQVPLAAHLWGDPLRVRRRLGRLLRALVVAVDDR